MSERLAPDPIEHAVCLVQAAIILGDFDDCPHLIDLLAELACAPFEDVCHPPWASVVLDCVEDLATCHL